MQILRDDVFKIADAVLDCLDRCQRICTCREFDRNTRGRLAVPAADNIVAFSTDLDARYILERNV